MVNQVQEWTENAFLTAISQKRNYIVENMIRIYLDVAHWANVLEVMLQCWKKYHFTPFFVNNMLVSWQIHVSGYRSCHDITWSLRRNEIYTGIVKMNVNQPDLSTIVVTEAAEATLSWKHFKHAPVLLYREFAVQSAQSCLLDIYYSPLRIG